MDALFNWLWQGCVVAAATAGVLAALRSARAHLRYVACWVALGILAVLPLAPHVLVPASAVTTVELSGAALPAVPAAARWTPAALLGTAWILWAAVFGTRLALAVWTLRRARVRCRRFPGAWANRLRVWTDASAGGRRTRLMLSNRVRAAAVFGGGTPIIAVSPTLIRHLTQDELDRIVVHEWVHVQRRDDLANLLQLVMRAIVGWHPAWWWIERRLQIEREIACDEATVALTGSSKHYAACLAKLASFAVSAEPLPVPAAVSAPALGVRIRRILSARHLADTGWSRSLAAGLVTALCTLAFVVSAIRVVRPAGAASFESLTPIDRTWVASAITPSMKASGPRETAAMPGTGKPGTAAPAARSSGAGAETDQPPASAQGPVPEGQSLAVQALEAVRNAPVASLPARPPGSVEAPALAPVAAPVNIPALSNASLDARTATPWGVAADAGLALGEGSKKAGVATAGFFSRLGRRVAGSF